jgi:hypothetical protein
MSVFVVQMPKPGPRGYVYDISPALQFGQPIYVFDAQDQPGLTPVPSMFHALKVLKDFGDDDYLLWAGGDPAGLAIAALAAGRANKGRFKFLRWERERDNEGKRNGRGFYIPIVLSLGGAH